MKIHNRHECRLRRFSAVTNVLMFFLSILLVTGQLPDTAYAQAVSSTGNLKSAAIQIRMTSLLATSERTLHASQASTVA